MTRILATATLNPAHRHTTADILAAATELWFPLMEEPIRRSARLIFKGAEIDVRHSVDPIEEVFTETSFAEKNNRYIECMIELGSKVLRMGLERAGIQATEINHLITCSCTGYMIPSVDAHLVNRLGMRQDISRLPVTEMGCAGGTSALIYANHYLRANPGHKVAIVSVETPSLTFQKHDFSMENIVSSAIFADGAACVILDHSDQPGPGAPRPVIRDTSMYHFPNQIHLMGYELRNSGLKIVLDKDVPKQIEQHFPNILLPFLERNDCAPPDIDHYLFHPGGKKIIHMVRDYVQQYDKDISDSLEVLRLQGNMSSATILHILDRFLDKDIPAGECGYMLAFGPGFMAQSLMLEWQH